MKTINPTQTAQGIGRQASASGLAIFLGVFVSILVLTAPQRVEAVCTLICGDGFCGPDPNNPGCFCFLHRDDPACGVLPPVEECTCPDGTKVTKLDPNKTCSAVCGDPIVVNSCTPLLARDIVRQGCGTVFAVDPGTGDTLVDEEVKAGSKLSVLTERAIDDVMQLHGLPASERNNVSIWARDRVRAQLYTRLSNIITADDRTDDEQALYNWLTNVVWQKRIAAAQAAWDQYRAWELARATCSYHEPNHTGYLGLSELGTLENNDACVTNGGTCFAGLPSFTHDDCDLSACDGFPLSPACLAQSIPAHPTYQHFKQYGAAIANKVYAEEPRALSVLTGTGKGLAIGIGVAAAVIVGAVTAAVLASFAIAFAQAVFPIAATISNLAGAIVWIGAPIVGSIFAVATTVVIGIIIIIVSAIQLADFQRIPVCLKEDIKIAAGVNVSPRACGESAQQGKPNLAMLITSDSGRQEIFLAFVAATLPEAAHTAAAPAPQSTPFWAVRNGSGTPLPSESGALLDLTSWPDPEGNPTLFQAGLYNGWFVAEIPRDGGETINVLTLGIEYVNHMGEKWTAWRSKCQQGGTQPCSPGKDIFILTRNGDEPPQGVSEQDFAQWFSTASAEIPYKNHSGQPRIASLHTAPSVTGFMSTGDFKEGSQLTLRADSSSPGATVAWDFGDGGTGSGSPVMHTFADNGTYNVTVTVTDELGSQGTGAFPVTITNVVPTIETVSASPEPSEEGMPVTIHATFSDPGTQDTHTCSVLANGSLISGQVDGLTCTAQTIYRDNGNQNVEVTVFDKDGGSSDSFTVAHQVINVPPQFTAATPDSVDEQQLVQISGRFQDQGPDDTPQQVSIDWGDGSSENGIFAASEIPGGVEGEFTFQHRYLDDNPTGTASDRYTITLEVRDKDGGVNGSSTTIAVNNVAPAATIDSLTDETGAVVGSDTSVVLVGSPMHLAGSFTDVGTQDTHTATMDWGDGASTTPALIQAAGSGAVTDTHVYEAPGLYALTLAVTDDDTQAGTATVSVAVVDPIGATQAVIETLAALTSDPSLDADTAAVLADALADLQGNNGGAGANGALDLLAKDNLNAALEKIKHAERRLAELEGVDVTSQRRTLALTAKAVALAAIAQAESTATRSELRKIDRAKVLVGEGDALLAAGDYITAVRRYQAAVRAVANLMSGK